MIFLAALLFVGILFVVPGEILLIACSRLLGAQGLADAQIWLTVLNVGVFVGVWVCVRSFPRVYSDFRLVRREHHRMVKHLFDVRGCEWICGLGIVTILTFSVVAFLTDSFPPPLWYLVVVALAGFLDLHGRRDLIDEIEDFPPPRSPSTVASMPRALDESTSIAKTEFTSEVKFAGRLVSPAWEFSPTGSSADQIRFCYEATILDEEYDRARKVARFPRRPYSALVKYVLWPSEGVKQMAAWFRQQTQERALSRFQEVLNVATMVRTIPCGPYQNAPGKSGYTNFPVETLYEMMGNHDSHAILAAAVLHELGHDVALVVMESADAEKLALGYHHAATSGFFSVRSKDGRDFVHIETSAIEATSATFSTEVFGKLSQAVVLTLT